MIEWVEKAVQKYDGDIAEIGLGTGETTIRLLEVAEKYDRKVYGVDPFESGWADMPESYGRPYSEIAFRGRIENYKHRFVHQRSNSLSIEAFQFLQRPLAFAYVDGLQFFGAVLWDLQSVSHAGIIVVDDYNRNTAISQVPGAVDQFVKDTGRKLIVDGRWAVITKFNQLTHVRTSFAATTEM